MLIDEIFANLELWMSFLVLTDLLNLGMQWNLIYLAGWLLITELILTGQRAMKSNLKMAVLL